MKMIKKIDSIIEQSCTYLLIFCVFSMLFLTVFTIVFRFFSISLHWIEPLIRHLVFLSIFLGGAIATGKGSHISINILERYLTQKKKQKILLITKLFINVICICTLILVLKTSLDLIAVEKQYTRLVFLGIKSHQLIGIIPLGLGLMIFRFFAKLWD